ncbi:MAG: DUF1175 family protein [Thermoanaerobaculia bacterium]
MRALGPLVALFLAAAGVSETGAARFRLLNEALSQAESPRPDWDPAQRDCAGFVRFLFRKSLGSEATEWVRAGGAHAPFVSAGELLAYNFTRVSTEPLRDRVETGDLLAFYEPNKARADAWHLMVLLRPPGGTPDRILVVYHNGGAGRDAAVRKVWLDDLAIGPPEWRPSPDNTRFLGTFRWNGWIAGTFLLKEK